MESEQIAIKLYKVLEITKWLLRESLFGNKLSIKVPEFSDVIVPGKNLKAKKIILIYKISNECSYLPYNNFCYFE